jgi:hypothetical protein
MPYPPQKCPVELLEEGDLEEYYEDLCKGNWQSIVGLPHHQAHQVLAFAMALNAKWLVELEQRTKA